MKNRSYIIQAMCIALLWLTRQGLLAQQGYSYVRADLDTVRSIYFSPSQNISNLGCNIRDVKCDEDGSIYVLGEYDEARKEFDGTRICDVDTLDPPHGLFVAKYDTNMEQQWLKSVVGKTVSLPCMAVLSGKVYIIFSCHLWCSGFSNPSRSGMAWLHYFDTTYYKPYGVAWSDCFAPPFDTIWSQTIIAVLDESGTLISERSIVQRGSAQGASWIGPRQMTIDNSGNLYVVAETVNRQQMVFDLDRGAAQRFSFEIDSATLEKRVGSSNYIFKFDKDLLLQWVKPQVDSITGVARPDICIDECKQLICDDDGNIYTINYLTENALLGLGVLWLDSVHYITCESSWNYYLVKYNPDGDILWCQQDYFADVDPSRSMGVLCFYVSSAEVVDDRLYLMIYFCQRMEVISDAIPNCFFDREHQHPLVFHSTHQGVIVEYDRYKGEYLRHDTVPSTYGAGSGIITSRSNYLVGGINLIDANKDAIHYHCRRNLETDVVYYGNPQAFRFSTAAYRYNYNVSSYGHVSCRTPVSLVVLYDTLLDMRRIRYDILALPADSTRGTVEGSGTYRPGDTVILTATPFEGYHFTQWNDSVTDNPRTIVVTQNHTYLAHFASDDGIPSLSPNPYSLNIYPNPTTGELRVECGELRVEMIELLDLQGRVVRGFQKSEASIQQNQNTETWTLDLSSLPKGSYLVRCGSAVKKLVVN